MIDDDPMDDPISVDFQPTEESPWTFKTPPQPTFEGNLIAEISLQGSTAAHQFLIGIRADGWYIVMPTPFHDRYVIPEEWCYDWLGPYLTRADAIQDLPKALERHIQNCREHLDTLEEQVEWLADHAQKWTGQVPAHRIPPKLQRIR